MVANIVLSIQVVFLVFIFGLVLGAILYLFTLLKDD